jgi:hypothetical protein
MKRIVGVLFTIFFILTLSAVNITIGGSGAYNGPTESPCPYANTYRNERVQYIIGADELQAAGGGAGPINSVSLNVATLNGVGPLSNYRIKIGHTARGAWTYSDKTFVQGLTEVWRASVYQPSLGANNHYFTQPFVWDGVSNIVVDMGYSLTSYYAPKTANAGTNWTWCGATRSAYMLSDAMNACEEPVAYSVSNYRADFTFSMGALTPTIPNTAVPILPGSGTVNVAIPTTISWISGGGSPQGYKLYLGTVNPPPLLADMQQDSTYTSTLAYSTTYFWKVVPYNSYGDAVDCPVWTFTTRADPVVHSFPWETDFGSGYGISFPPQDWTKHSGVLSDSTSLGSAGTGLWSLSYWLNQGNTNRAPLIPLQASSNGWLITPVLDIPTANYELNFDVAMVLRYTSQAPDMSGYDDIFAVLASSDSTWNNSKLLRKWDNAGSQYVLNSLGNVATRMTIPLGSAGQKQIAFYAGSTFSNATNQIFIDNVQVRLNPGLPGLSYNPPMLDFGLGIQFDANNVLELSISNSGLDTLRVAAEDISIIGDSAECFSIDSSALPFALSAGQSGVLPVHFNPNSEGEKVATLRIVNNQCRQNFDLTLRGEALPHPTVVIGTDEVTLTHLPIDANTGFSYSQSIVLQSEINLLDKQINKLWLYWDSYHEGSRSHEWCIYMGHTAKTAFDNGDDWVPASSLSKVFEGWVDLPAIPGWIGIELQTPFLYNNSSNLIIATQENESLYLGYSVGFRGCNVSSPRSIAYSSSANNAGPDNPYTGTLYNQIPNMMLVLGNATTEPKVQVSHRELDFCAQESGDAFGPLNLVFVRNVGGGTLFFNSNTMSLQGNNASEFTVYGDGMSMLQNDQYASFLLRFTPQTAGIKTASLVIPGNATPDTLLLKGISYLPGSFAQNFETILFPPEGWERSDQQWVQSAFCDYIPELILHEDHSAVSLLNNHYPESHLTTPYIRLDTGEKYLSYLIKGYNNNYWYGASTLKLSYKIADGNEWVSLADSLWFYYDERERYVIQDISALPANVYQFRFSVVSSFWWGEGDYYSVVALDDVRCTGTLATPYLEIDRSEALLASGQGESVQVEVSAWGAWTATSSASWLHVSESSGSSNASLNVYADANTGLSARTATITFSNGQTPDRVCSIRQHGLRGNALDFDGFDDYVVMQHPSGAFNNAFSISTWVKWQPSSASDIDFICANNFEQMEIHTGASDNNLRFIPTTGVYLDAGPVLPTNTWVHIVCAYSASPAEAHIWVNGVEQSWTNNGSNPVGTPISGSLGSFYLGRRADTSYYFQGRMDEFSLWNTVLSSAQVSALMTAPPALDSYGLQQYYSFNSGVPAGANADVVTLPDHKSNMNGTLHNFTLSGSSSNWVSSEAMLPVFLSSPSLRISTNAVLSWDAVPGADSYRIYRASSPNGTFELIAQTYNTSWQADSSSHSAAFFKVIAVSDNSRSRYKQ